MTKSLSTKKILAIVVGFVIAFSTVSIGTAKAETADDLQAQIQSLLQMITGLKAQLGIGGTTTTTTTTGGAVTTTSGSCVPVRFTFSHKVGSRGGDVMEIQKFLNRNGFSVATYGAGSPGSETSYFGPATKRAVMAFQNRYASEVLAPVSLSYATGYWGMSSRTKANTMETSRCANVQVPTTGTGTTDTSTTTTTTTSSDGVTVSVDAQPSNSLAPKNASNIPFTRFTLTAGDSDVTVNDVTVELSGLAVGDSFASVQLLDEDGMLVGDEEDLDEDTDQARVGGKFTLKANESKTFTVAATRNGVENTGGQVAAFSVVSVNTKGGASVKGTLPIMGAQHIINTNLNVAKAQLELTNVSGAADTSGGDTSPTVVEMADMDVDIATMEINVSNEDVRVSKIRLHNAEDADLTETLKNIRAEIDGNEYDVDVDRNYLTVDFGKTGIIIDTDDATLEITAEIKGGAGDDIQLELENEADFVARGSSYGYGINITNSAASDYVVRGGIVRVKTGAFHIKKDSDFEEQTVSAGTNDAAFGGFKTDFQGQDVTGDVKVTIEMSSPVAVSANDVRIRNFGVTKKGKTAKLSDKDREVKFNYDGSTTTASTVVTIKKVTFPADSEELFYELRGDVNSNVKDQTTYRVTEVNVTNTKNEDRDSVASSQITGPMETTVQSAHVELTLSSPSPSSVNDDSSDEEVAKITVNANDSGDDIVLKKITLTATSTEAAKIKKCRVYDGSGEITRTDENFVNGTIEFNIERNYKITKDTSKDLTVKCDLDDGITTATSIAFSAMNFDAQGDKTDVDLSNGSNGGIASGSSNVTVKDGVFEVKVTNSDDNDNKIVKNNTSNVVLAEIKIEANDGPVTLDKIEVDLSTLADIFAATDKVKVSVGGRTKSVTAATTMLFDITNLHMDKGDEQTLVITGNVDGDANDATASTTITEVRIIDTNAATTTASTASQAYPSVQVAKGIPVVEKIDVASDSLGIADDIAVFAFKVTADGDADMVLNSIKLVVEPAGVMLNNPQIKVFDNKPSLSDHNGMMELLQNGDINTSFATGADATVNAAIDKGNSVYIYAVGDISASSDTRSIRVRLKDEAGSLVFSDATITADMILNGDIKSLLKKD